MLKRTPVHPPDAFPRFFGGDINVAEIPRTIRRGGPLTINAIELSCEVAYQLAIERAPRAPNCAVSYIVPQEPSERFVRTNGARLSGMIAAECYG